MSAAVISLIKILKKNWEKEVITCGSTRSRAASRSSGSGGCLLGGEAPGACAKLSDNFAPLIRRLLIMTQIYDTS